MGAPTLHDEGWRQGSLIRELLEVHTLGIGEDGSVGDRTEWHDLWMLATQDCDLDQTKCTNTTRQFELRPVYARNANDRDVEGWRTRTVLVKDGLVLRADSPKLTLSAPALQALKSKREEAPDEDRRVQIKIWLGLRYDRPAIPKKFVLIGQTLEAKIIKEMPAHFKGVIRDAWVYFEETPGEVRIFVILGDAYAECVQGVLDWLDDDIIPALQKHDIFVQERQAATSRGTSLWILETYFGLDKADLSLTG